MRFEKQLTGSWRKSSKSSTGNCVEFAVTVGRVVLVRDSKDVAGPRLSFSAAAWSNFTVQVGSEER